MNEKKISVAIDGPSGAGKSTVARALAERFRLIYVDTGAIYRTVGLAAQRADGGGQAEQVAYAVVNDRRDAHSRIPLVDGISSSNPASIAVAWRMALPRALNMPSMM